jgi:hypothetical protein
MGKYRIIEHRKVCSGQSTFYIECQVKFLGFTRWVKLSRRLFGSYDGSTTVIAFNSLSKAHEKLSELTEQIEIITHQ